MVLLITTTNTINKYYYFQPQNSMPDVVIWMIAGGKRIAYFRIPAYHVLWSSNPDYRGKFCGSLDTIVLQVRKISTLFSDCFSYF